MTSSEQPTPLLTELNAASGQLNRLTTTLPRFNDAATPAVETLGEASVVGRQALREGQRRDRRAERRRRERSYDAANPVANFLVDLDDPARAVEPDTARRGFHGTAGAGLATRALRA